MSTPVDPVQAAWLEEMNRAAVPSIRLACGLGAASFLGFALVDPYLVEGSLSAILETRAALLVGLFGLLLGTWHPQFHRVARAASFGVCLWIGFGVVIVTAHAGGGASNYHEALLLTMFGFALLPLPWTWPEATATYVALVGCYDATMAATGRMGAPSQWWTNNAVLWAAVVIAGSLVQAAGKLRMDSIQSRLSVVASNERLRDANEQLQELDRAKSRFFANLSHELRTPLTLALAPLDALLEGNERLTRRARADLQLSRRSALRMMRLVDDLLVLSRLESAKAPERRDPIDLVSLAARLVEEATPLAQRKRIELRWRPREPQAWVSGDGVWLERAFLNLLANALKFTPEGGSVELELRALGDHLTVQVRDTGPGIEASQLEKIFERFHQVDSSMTRNHAGIGIGLALVREVVTVHGGHVHAESAVGQGTTLTVSLPRMSGQEGAPRLLPQPPADAGVAEWHRQLTGSPDYRLMAVEEATERRLLSRADDGVPRPSVLVIEDDVDMLRLLGGLLGGDYDILTARDGVTGLRLLIQRRPDLLVTDLMLPGASGFEVVQQLRENPDVRETPVLMLTARGGVDDRVEAQERGVDAFLTKPFRRAELLATVDRLLRSHAHRSLGAERREAEHTERLVSGLLRAVEPPLAALEQQGASTAAIRSTLARLALLATGEPPTIHEVDVAAVVERVRARLPAEAAGRVRVTVTPTPPVQAHPPWLEQVLFELIDNALRVAPAQTPVDVGIAEDGDSVRVTVEDRGPGVPGVARTRIFHPFYTTRFAEPSAGLGLAIGRALARRIGGSLAMESGAEDRGVFVLRLPPSPRPPLDSAGSPP